MERAKVTMTIIIIEVTQQCLYIFCPFVHWRNWFSFRRLYGLSLQFLRKMLETIISWPRTQTLHFEKRSGFGRKRWFVACRLAQCLMLTQQDIVLCLVGQPVQSFDAWNETQRFKCEMWGEKKWEDSANPVARPVITCRLTPAYTIWNTRYINTCAHVLCGWLDVGMHDKDNW